MPSPCLPFVSENCPYEHTSLHSQKHCQKFSPVIFYHANYRYSFLWAFRAAFGASCGTQQKASITHERLVTKDHRELPLLGQALDHTPVPREGGVVDVDAETCLETNQANGKTADNNEGS